MEYLLCSKYCYTYPYKREAEGDFIIQRTGKAEDSRERNWKILALKIGVMWVRSQGILAATRVWKRQGTRLL